MIVPRFPQDRCVIISDSGAESLLACAMASEQQQISGAEPSILLPGWWGPTDEMDLLITAIDPAIVRQAGVYSLDVYPTQAVYPPDEIDEDTAPRPLGVLRSRMLLEAASIAMRSGIKRVVWPLRIMQPARQEAMSELIDEIANEIDRALLAARLATLDADDSTAVEVVIETPFVDLSNEQAADLALDMALPLESCWFASGKSLPGAREAREFWGAVSARAGVQVETKPAARTHA